MTIESTPAASQPREKLAGYEFYNKVLGAPKYIVAPMVDQSELAFRTLTRRYGAQVVYTPMINAKMFADTTHKYYREQYFDIASGEEGAYALASSTPGASTSTLPPTKDTDRLLVVQFCGNNPSALLASALLVQDHCDAVDVNLGCPQDIARRGHYGAFLMEDWDLVFEMINILHKNLSVPVTAKFRVFPSIEKTVEYAKMLERAGAQIITCHGRTREQRGCNSGVASYPHIAAVKRAVSIPVFANGNILFSSDVARCLRETGADAVMSAEGVLYNPALFNGLPSLLPEACASGAAAAEAIASIADDLPLETTNPPSAPLALEYLALVRAQRTRTAPSAVKGHLFKILRPALGKEGYHDLRERLGRVRADAPRTRAGESWEWVDEYARIVQEAQARLEEDARRETDNGRISLRALIRKDEATGLDVLPWWLAQPYFRPLPKEPIGGKKGKKTGKADEVPVVAEQGPAKEARAVPTSQAPPPNSPVAVLSTVATTTTVAPTLDHDDMAATIAGKRLGSPPLEESEAKRTKVDV